MKKILLIVEGESDSVFLRDFIRFHFKSEILQEKENDKREIEMKCDDTIIKINSSGGYTTISSGKLDTRIKIDYDQGYLIVVIQDADNPSKNHGGVSNRMRYLEDVKSRLGINFEIFLFPNHNDDGDLEVLLLNMANEKKFNVYHQNYHNYTESIKAFSDETHGMELMQDKYRVFNYFQVYHGMEKAKEKNRQYYTEYWDLSNPSAKALLNFISKIIQN